jgi:hypothetical protein
MEYLYVSFLHRTRPSLIFVLACLALAKACDVAGLDEWHHNAGVDARDSLASVLVMMREYPGVHPPGDGHDMPILVAVDL